VADTGAEKGSVSIWFVRQAVAGMRRRGQDPAPELAAAGIPANLLQSEQSRVSPASFGALWLGIAARLDDEFFGLDARRMKVGSFALLCRMCILAPRLRQALQLAVQFFNAVLDDQKLEWAEEADGACVRIVELNPSHRPPEFQVFAHETALIMLHGLLCWLVGRRIPIEHAAFRHARPPWWREYLLMYSTELRFESEQTEIRFAVRQLDAPVIQDEASAREFLREAPHNFIVKFKDPKSWSARVRQRLRSAPPEQWPSFAELAAEFDVASSTLHRKLELEGASFREIKDDLRLDLAIDRLTHSDASVAEIASDLGFAEPSAFHRAFKTWTGVRPGDYRRKESEPRTP
jgi:AraC-like DNA-binding protein